MALQHVTIHQQPSDEMPNAVERYPASVADLRSRLFRIVIANGPECALATKCLNVIDELRDILGVASEDPRHPDIELDWPWPIVP